MIRNINLKGPLFTDDPVAYNNQSVVIEFQEETTTQPQSFLPRYSDRQHLLQPQPQPGPPTQQST